MLHGASFVFEIRYLEFSEQNGAKRPSLAITRTWCFPRSAERPRSHARTWGVRGCEFAPDATSLWWCKHGTGSGSITHSNSVYTAAIAACSSAQRGVRLRNAGVRATTAAGSLRRAAAGSLRRATDWERGISYTRRLIHANGYAYVYAISIATCAATSHAPRCRYCGAHEAAAGSHGRGALLDYECAAESYAAHAI